MLEIKGEKQPFKNASQGILLIEKRRRLDYASEIDQLLRKALDKTSAFSYTY
jgi:hypothetical protein